MTRDELREQVARAICYSDMNDDVFDELSAYQKQQFICNADAAIDTIFAAMKEPTEDMSDAGVKSDVLLSAIIDWQGSYTPKEDVASDIWELMLSASPLAPKGKEE